MLSNKFKERTFFFQELFFKFVLGGNVLLAKMATKKAKPNGQFYLKGDDVMDFMKDQSVQNIPGILFQFISGNCHCHNWFLYFFIKKIFFRKVS